MVCAVHRMRAWQDDWERGNEGVWVEPGDLAVILQVWRVGRSRTRLRVLVKERIAMFSCYTRDLDRNWQVKSRELHLSGSA